MTPTLCYALLQFEITKKESNDRIRINDYHTSSFNSN